jgi:hypothetical protein
VAQLPLPLLLWRYGCHRGRMTGAISSQSMVLVPPLTMHGHVHHVDGASIVLGVPVASRFARGSMCPSSEAETLYGGSGAFDDTAGAQARWSDSA